MGRGGEGGRVRGEGKDGCDETLITSSFLITHSYRSLQNKTLIAYKHVSYVLWEEVSAHVSLLFSQMVLVSIYRRLIYNF